MRRDSTHPLIGKAPDVQRLGRVEDVHTIEFTDDLALVEVPIELIDKLPLRNDGRSNSPRLRKVLNSIRAYGYNNADPVICYIGRKGNWVVEDGGHRLTAARKVSREWLTNLFTKKVRFITFLLFLTPSSYIRFQDAETPLAQKSREQ